MISAALPRLLMACIAIATAFYLPVSAFAQPDSTYLVNDSVYIRASPKKITSSFNYDSVSFDVNYNYRTGRTGGLVGGGGYFRGKVTVMPVVTFDTGSRVLNVSLYVKGEFLEARSPGGLGELFYGLAAQDVSYADQQIHQMKVYLGNRDTVVEVSGGRTYFRVPDDVTTLNGIEVLYDGGEGKVRKRLFFGKAGGFGGGSSFPWIIAIIVAGALVAAYAAKKNKDKKKRSWIEITLLDNEQKPVANEACSIVLHDGTVIKQKTNSAGKIRLQGIQQGKCRISFPDLDGREWSASATPITEKIET